MKSLLKTKAVIRVPIGIPTQIMSDFIETVTKKFTLLVEDRNDIKIQTSKTF